MAWRRIDDKPLSEPTLTQFTDAYMRHYGGRWVNSSPPSAAYMIIGAAIQMHVEARVEYKIISSFFSENAYLYMAQIHIFVIFREVLSCSHCEKMASNRLKRNQNFWSP